MRPRFFLVVTTVVFLVAAQCFAGDGNLMELARIQTGLNRAASGMPSQAELSDPLERIVAAFSEGWVGPGADPVKAEPILQEVEAEIIRRSEKLAPGYRDHFSSSFDLPGHLAELEAAAKKDLGPLARFILALHGIDTVLIAENVKPWGFNYDRRDYVQFPSDGQKAVGAWLRVPCRVLLGHEAEFRTAVATLGELADPVLDCPSAAKESTDLNTLAAFARNPAAARSIARYVLPGSAAPPMRTVPPVSFQGAWSHEAAVAFMARDPHRAEARLRRATTPGQKLDYALFLFAFHKPSPRRDTKIRGLLAAINASAPQTSGRRVVEDLPPFNGSATGMIAAVSSEAIYGPASGDGTDGPYAIPCAVLVRVPALAKAMETQYGGGRDQWLPKSGCAAGRGNAPGFPETEVRSFEKAAVAPTHDWIKNYEGSLVATYIQGRLMRFEVVRLGPKVILADRDLHTAPTPPYLVWSYLTLDNKRIQAKTQDAFMRAKTALAAYYRRKGLSAASATRAADAGLRSLAYGWDCGGAAPLRASLRTMLLDGASLDRIKAFARSGAWRDTSRIDAFMACDAGQDPLVHVAVARPDALAFLWDFAAHEPDMARTAGLELGPETRNAFGKTPLMSAAQIDQARSVRLLSLHGADPNARTSADGLAWAYRTPLMYAAANASLPVIRMLLAAGADPQAADSKGAKALHYLLGYGPVPANPRLAPKDFAEAARLLY